MQITFNENMKNKSEYYKNIFNVISDKDILTIHEVYRYLRFITLDSNDVWFDLGSNLGWYNLLINKSVKKIISVEASSRNCDIFFKNMQDNNINNFELINAAVVGNEDQTRTLNLCDNTETTTCHSLVNRTKSKNKEIVKCVNINTLLNNYTPNKIKMDVEGSEYDILKNMNFKNLDEIILEWHFNIIKSESKYFEIINLLKTHFKYVHYLELPGKNWVTNIVCNNYYSQDITNHFQNLKGNIDAKKQIVF